MASTTSQLSPDIRQRLDDGFARLGQGVNAYVMIDERRELIAALDASSDADLGRIGLTRDRILAYVFRDLIWN